MSIEDELRTENLLLQNKICSYKAEITRLHNKIQGRTPGSFTPKSRCNNEKREKVYKITSGKCFYCHNKHSESIDHLIPRSKGGSNRIENMVPACFSCNHKKKDGIATASQISRAFDLHRMFGNVE